MGSFVSSLQKYGKKIKFSVIFVSVHELTQNISFVKKKINLPMLKYNTNIYDCTLLIIISMSFLHLLFHSDSNMSEPSVFICLFFNIFFIFLIVSIISTFLFQIVLFDQELRVRGGSSFPRKDVCPMPLYY